MFERYTKHALAHPCGVRLTLALTVLVLATFISGATLAAPPAIFIAYPPENHSVAFDHVLFEGSVPAGATLTVDGRAVDVGTDGLFIEWLPLKPGLNVLRLQSTLGAERSQREFRVISRP